MIIALYIYLWLNALLAGMAISRGMDSRDRPLWIISAFFIYILIGVPMTIIQMIYFRIRKWVWRRNWKQLNKN